LTAIKRPGPGARDDAVEPRSQTGEARAGNLSEIDFFNLKEPK